MRARARFSKIVSDRELHTMIMVRFLIEFDRNGKNELRVQFDLAGIWLDDVM